MGIDLQGDIFGVLAGGYVRIRHHGMLRLIHGDFGDAVHQRIDVRPAAVFFYLNADCAGIVTENQTEEAAQPYIFFPGFRQCDHLPLS